MKKLLLSLVSHRRRFVALLVAPLLGLGTMVVFAYWTTHGAGSASATVGTLAGPGQPVGTPSVGSVALSWTAGSPAPPGGLDGYYVQRNNGRSTSDACGTVSISPRHLISSLTCTDTVPASGTYTYTVTAVYKSWTAVSASSSPVTVSVVGPLDHFLVTAPPGTVTAGTPITVSVTAQDASGNTVTGFTGSVSFTSSDSQAVLPGSYTFLAGDGGTHSFPNAVTLKTAGTRTVSVTGGGKTGTSASITVTAAGVSKLAFTTVPSGGQTASATATIGAYQVQEQDSYGNPVVAAATVTVNLSTTSAGTTGHAPFFTPTSGGSSGSAVTIASGASLTGTFFYADTVAGSPTLTASASGIVNGTSTSPTILAAAVNKLVFTGTPSGMQTASATATIGAYQVQEQDVFGNPAVAGSTVTVTLSSNSTGTKFFSTTSGSGIGTAVTSVSISSGSTLTGTFYYSDTKAGGPILTAHSALITNDGTSSPTIVAAAVNKLVFATVPSGSQTASATATIGAYQVQEQDAFGNPVVAGSAVTVNLASTSTGTKFFSASSGGAIATAVTSVLIASGASTTASLYYSDTKAGSPTLTASATGIANNGTSSPTIVAAAVNKLSFSAVPSGNQTASSTATIGAYQVQEQDSFGNPAAAGSTVTLNLSTSSIGTAGHTPFFTPTSGGSSASVVTIPSGQSASGGFYYSDTLAGSPTLTAQATGVTNSGTTSTAIVAGAPAALVYTSCSAPSGCVNGTGITQIVGNGGSYTAHVGLTDSFGNATTFASALTINVIQDHLGTGTLNTSTSPLTLAANAAQTAGTVTYQLPTGSPPTVTVSASASGQTWTSATVAVKK